MLIHRLKYFWPALVAGLFLIGLCIAYLARQDAMQVYAEPEAQHQTDLLTDASENVGVSEEIEIRLNGLENDMHKLQESITHLTSNIEEISLAVSQIDNKNSHLQIDSEIKLPDNSSENVIKIPERTVSQRLALLDDHLLQTQFTDPTWAFWAETEVTELLNSSPELNITQSQTIECSGALCKIDIIIPKDKLVGMAEPLFEVALLQALASKGMTSSSQVTQKQVDGSVHKIFYMPREGHKLPKVTSNN